MQRAEDGGSAVLPALWAGLALGVGVMAGLSLVLALVAWQLPVAPGQLRGLAVAGQVAAALLAGLRSGRRAGTGGLLQGLLVGAALTLLLAAIDGIAAGFPGAGALLRRGALLAAAGAIGGSIGVMTRP